MKRVLCILAGCAALFTSAAQPQHAGHHGTIAGTRNAFTYVEAPAVYLYSDILGTQPTSTFNINFHNFPSQEARDAFTTAAAIWSHLVVSYVTINVEAIWDTMPEGTLAATKVLSTWANSPGLQPDTWYPVAMAEAITFQNLNGTESEIEVTVNSNMSTKWYYGTDGNTPAGKYDFVTLILHELGHGLGFDPSFDVDANGFGRWGSGTPLRPYRYDKVSVVGPTYPNSDLLINYPDSSTLLAGKLKSDNVYFSGPISRALNNFSTPKLYAPNEWKPGSSISHLDENVFPAGTRNSLMTPVQDSAEANHTPGEVGISMLEDLGWNVNRVVTITKPVAGVVWQPGGTYTLEWSDNRQGVLFVELWKKNPQGQFEWYRTLADQPVSVQGLNAYNLTVPADVIDGTYKIKMLDEVHGYGLSFAFAVSTLPQVASPTIIPPGGVYASGEVVPVSLGCSTPGATIRFTINAPAPDSTNGTVYAGPFNITTNSVVRARAFKTGMVPSTTTEATFTFENAARFAQVDETGVPFGPYWFFRYGTTWFQYNEPTLWNLTNTPSVKLKATQDYKPETVQKYHRWLRNNTTAYIVNHADIPGGSSARTVIAWFKSAANASVTAELLEGGTGGDSIRFKDPWFVDDFTDSLGDRNRGAAAIWHTRQLPFYLSTDSSATGSEHKGVFLNQAIEPGKPYYSVGAPQSQQIGDLYGDFQYWTVTQGSANFQNANATETGVVFNEPNTTVTAMYKAARYTASAVGTATNNQRKIARSNQGVYCMVYESNNRIWFVRSNNAVNWSQDIPISDESTGAQHRYPSIVVKGEIANIVWQSIIWVDLYNEAEIQLVRYDITNDEWGSIETVGTFIPGIEAFKATPVIDASILSHLGPEFDSKAIAWREPDGIKIREFNFGLWGEAETVEGTHAECWFPSIINGTTVNYAICWEDRLSETIQYVEAVYSDGWRWSNAAQISPSGWSANQRPAMALAYDPGGCTAYKASVVWQSVNNLVEGVSVHVRQSGYGCNNWGNITSFSMSLMAQPHPTIGTYGTNKKLAVVWNESNDVYVATYNGGWSGPGLLASGAAGGTECNINAQSPSQLAALWRRPSGGITVTTSGVNPGDQEEEEEEHQKGVLTKEGSGSAERDSAVTKVPYRLNRHGFVQMRGALNAQANNVRGTVAFEIAQMKLLTPGGEKRLKYTKLAELPRGRSVLSSRPFVVPEAGQLLFAGASYGKRLAVPADSLATVNQPLAKAVLRDNRTGQVVRQIWRVPFSDLSIMADSTFGVFREVSVDLDGLTGRELFVDVEMLGHGRGITPLVDDDYLILGRGGEMQAAGGANKQTGDTPDKTIPTTYGLYQNYPNPFNPTTTIRLDLPEDQVVSLTVFNLLGQEVAKLTEGSYAAGEHSVRADFTALPSGVYLYRLRAGAFVDVKKLLVVK
jgi:hypothetical protein